ncbi:hypothetical protein L9F63_021383, partial [Diploptera punctata]
SYLVIKEPTTFNEKWNAFLMPFSSNMWTAVLLAIILIIICLRMMYMLGHQFANLNYEDLTCSTAAFLTIGVFCSE